MTFYRLTPTATLRESARRLSHPRGLVPQALSFQDHGQSLLRSAVGFPITVSHYAYPLPGLRAREDHVELDLLGFETNRLKPWAKAGFARSTRPTYRSNAPDQYPMAMSICCNSGPPASRLRMLAAISVTSWATVGRRATCGITVILGCTHSGLSDGNGSGHSASSAA